MKYSLSRRVSLGFLLACCAAASGATPSGVSVEDLKHWNIVVAEKAIPSEQYAAEQLQQYLARAIGEKLPLVSQTDRTDRHIFIGPGESMRESKLGFAVDDFGPEDLRIVVRDKNIVIAGGRPRGTLYGVYTFLEDCFGVRFLTADHTHVPQTEPDHVIDCQDRRYDPPLNMRWTFYGEVNRNPALATRMRVNTVASDPKFGGRCRQHLINHSFARQIPTSKYGKEHPEYFALRDGKRLAQVRNDSYGTQPCLTNPDVLRIVTESVLADIEGNPDAANVSVSQNDNAKHCLCPQCQALDQREDTPMGSLLTFVNSVADTVVKKHPDVMLGTLAYWYTRKPPKTIKPRPNVQIQLCSIECCLIHPINDPSCPRNVEFCRDLAKWGQLCDHIYIWNYNTNFSNYLLPCPNLRTIAPNIRYFVENNAKGVFMQAAGNANGAELSELRSYMISNLLWDPSRSGQRLMDEFLDLHYGPAAPPIRRYIKRIHDRAQSSGRHHNCFGRLQNYGLNATDTQAGLSAFREALRLAGTDELRQRVEKASLCAYRAALEPVWYRNNGPLASEMAVEMRPLAARFFNLCDKYNVDRPRESGEDTADAKRRLKRVFELTEDEPF